MWVLKRGGGRLARRGGEGKQAKATPSRFERSLGGKLERLTERLVWREAWSKLLNREPDVRRVGKIARYGWTRHTQAALSGEKKDGGGGIIVKGRTTKPVAETTQKRGKT